MFTLRFQTWRRWKRIRWSLAKHVGSKKGQIRLGGKAGTWQSASQGSGQISSSLLGKEGQRHSGTDLVGRACC